MDQTPRPERRLPAAVYRRRRIVVAFTLVVLVAVIWLAVRALTSGGDTDAESTPPPTSDPQATPTASPNPSPTTGTTSQATSIGARTPGDVTVVIGEPTVTA